MTEHNPVGWFEIYVSDTTRSKAFYEAVLGVPLQKLEPSGESVSDMWSFPMQQGVGGAAGAIVHMEGAPSGPGGTIVYFITADCAEAATKVEQNGGKVVRPKFSIGQYGNIALAADPDGNIIGFHSMT